MASTRRGVRALVLATLGVTAAGYVVPRGLGPTKRRAGLLARHVQIPEVPESRGNVAPDECEELGVEELRTQYLDAVADLNAKKRALVEVEQRLGVCADQVSDPWDYDFGFISRSAGIYTGLSGGPGAPAGPPPNVFITAKENFLRESKWIMATLSGQEKLQPHRFEVSDRVAEFRAQLEKLTLSNDKVWAREKARPEVEAPFFIWLPYFLLCFALDLVFLGRPIQRFWFLETVARMPYFAYISMLHLYESLGWWRRSAETKRVHFAEEWNEYHHLMIMEALGGDQAWFDRFIAGHAAVAYYWFLVLAWLLSPSLAYNFSELIEAHAVDTYGEFVDENADLLRTLPAPKIARDYYTASDLYFFDEFQTSAKRGERRPPIDNLLDVFIAIRDDEKEHVATMAACQDPSVVVQSPRTEIITGATLVAAVAFSKYFETEAGQELTAGLLERAGLEPFFQSPVISSIVDFLAGILDAASGFFFL